MLKDLGREDWLTTEPSRKEQNYFANWDFAAPQTLRIEFGLANVMEQYDRNFKVRSSTLRNTAKSEYQSLQLSFTILA